MRDGELTKWRGEIVERFANVEYLINAIISQYYFKEVRLDFFHAVLYNEYFNFALRRSILERIIEQLGLIHEYRKEMQQGLINLNQKRNYFAHCALKLYERPDSGAYLGVVDPKDKNKPIGFKEVYDEFFSKVGGIEKFLAKLAEKLGVKWLKN